LLENWRQLEVRFFSPTQLRYLFSNAYLLRSRGSQAFTEPVEYQAT
jgi:hypothetical protein